ncbi:MAG: hypothetical protein QF903_12035 [Planctomycetota bacterium]|jgi:hypothetical protein|nr:hypothetical protein [Planctomycetota bacterium]MDP6761696.1 hypothetical protein [Planctomycetota bacterium]MDP6990190.1 hypothetical protein [Planctomycetota bacterium]
MDTTREDQPDRHRARLPKRGRRALLAGLLGLAVSAGAGELIFREVLFGEGFLTEHLGGEVRQAVFFTDPDADGDYWKLHHLFTDRARRDTFVRKDELVGWLDDNVVPGTYEHAQSRWLVDRRPVLMYGDSFAACVVPDASCWQGLLEKSPLRSEFMMLNYGTSAFGLDQAYLLMGASIDLWMDRDPVVVIGVLVDNDLDRCLLDFRGCPKPVLRLADGELAVEPPRIGDVDEWLEEHPPAITSYLWRYLAVQAPWWPAFLRPPRGDEPGLVARKSAISRAIIEALATELRAREVEFFFVFFHAPESAASEGPWGWREELLVDVCTELSIPFVSSKRALREDHAATGGTWQDYYVQEGTMRGHLSQRGNRAVFPAILGGLRGEYDG